MTVVAENDVIIRYGSDQDRWSADGCDSELSTNSDTRLIRYSCLNIPHTCRIAIFYAHVIQKHR